MTTLLAVGDMHLGRPAVALPADLASRRDRLGPEIAWQRAVEAAVEHKVDAVLLAGDVVERNRDFFVAYGQLKAGVQALAEAKIPVLAVAGNHDTDVLPRLADEIDALHLLGRDGQWQAIEVDEVTVIGWSFPHPQVRRNPLDTLKIRREGRPIIGLLHCDRDQADSHHAPVTSRSLERAEVDAWLLGHIHRPDDLGQERPIGYLGSISALRASETGARGAWLVRIEDGAIAADHLALAPLRYEALEIDCGALEQIDDLGTMILEACRQSIEAIVRQRSLPDALGFRIRLGGRTRLASQLPAAAEALVEHARSWKESGIACFFQKVEVAALPHINLSKLAEQNDPCGLLARRLIALDDPDSKECRRLVRLGHDQLGAVVRAREFRELDRHLDDAAVAATMRQAGLVALGRLIGQREDKP